MGGALPDVPQGRHAGGQLSLDERKPPAFHYDLGRKLRGLRKRGVLIVGSGNIVHNLRQDGVALFAGKVTLGSMAMRSARIG